MLKAIVVSKGTEESLKRIANNWKEALTEADALRRKRDSLQQAVNRMTKELTVKEGKGVPVHTKRSDARGALRWWSRRSTTST